MLRGVIRWLAARVGRDGEADDGTTDDSRFVPSELDRSVRYAHGMSDTGVERELADVEEEARRLGEYRRDG